MPAPPTSKGQVQKRMPRGLVGREVGPLGVRQQVPKASVVLDSREVDVCVAWELELLGVRE